MTDIKPDTEAAVPAAPVDPNAVAITVNVFTNGDIAVNGRVVDLRAIRANIERVHAEFPNSGVLLLADEGAKNGLIIEAADQVRLGGIQDITFSTSQ